ncbi:hypothetical protein [Salinisphaera orenii]|uniref:hypothetical protein n=1 Tax=Salinisphaera orenii TaxID=856731 RepID=UPI0011CDC9CA|nr:hypothetical protein [Salinisphaera halophila]
MRFPSPTKLAPNCSRWPLSALEKYEADRLGYQHESRPPDREIYLSDIQVAARYNVSRNSVWRWAREGAEVAA